MVSVVPAVPRAVWVSVPSAIFWPDARKSNSTEILSHASNLLSVSVVGNIGKSAAGLETIYNDNRKRKQKFARNGKGIIVNLKHMGHDPQDALQDCIKYLTAVPDVPMNAQLELCHPFLQMQPSRMERDGQDLIKFRPNRRDRHLMPLGQDRETKTWMNDLSREEQAVLYDVVKDKETVDKAAVEIGKHGRNSDNLSPQTRKILEFYGICIDTSIDHSNPNIFHALSQLVKDTPRFCEAVKTKTGRALVSGFKDGNEIKTVFQIIMESISGRQIHSGRAKTDVIKSVRECVQLLFMERFEYVGAEVMEGLTTEPTGDTVELELADKITENCSLQYIEAELMNYMKATGPKGINLVQQVAASIFGLMTATQNVDVSDCVNDIQLLEKLDCFAFCAATVDASVTKVRLAETAGKCATARADTLEHGLRSLMVNVVRKQLALVGTTWVNMMMKKVEHLEVDELLGQVTDMALESRCPAVRMVNLLAFSVAFKKTPVVWNKRKDRDGIVRATTYQIYGPTSQPPVMWCEDEDGGGMEIRQLTRFGELCMARQQDKFRKYATDTNNQFNVVEDTRFPGHEVLRGSGATGAQLSRLLRLRQGVPWGRVEHGLPTSFYFGGVNVTNFKSLFSMPGETCFQANDPSKFAAGELETYLMRMNRKEVAFVENALEGKTTPYLKGPPRLLHQPFVGAPNARTYRRYCDEAGVRLPNKTLKY